MRVDTHQKSRESKTRMTLPASALPARPMPDCVEEFLVNRDFQVNNRLFTKQSFFPLRCVRPPTRVSGAAILRDVTWNPEMESCLQEVMRVRWEAGEKELHSDVPRQRKTIALSDFQAARSRQYNCECGIGRFRGCKEFPVFFLKIFFFPSTSVPFQSSVLNPWAKKYFCRSDLLLIKKKT